MKIQPIVEGFGEVEAVPVLVRRLIAEAQCFGVQVSAPIRRTQSQLRNQDGVQAAVRLAVLQPECGAVLILFDEEDGCPVGATLGRWTILENTGLPTPIPEAPDFFAPCANALPAIGSAQISRRFSHRRSARHPPSMEFERGERSSVLARCFTISDICRSHMPRKNSCCPRVVITSGLRSR